MKAQVAASPAVDREALAEARRLWEQMAARPAHFDPFLGWLEIDSALEGSLPQILDIAREVRQEADAFVVVGIGGSNQAARAVIDALGARGIEVCWAGNTLSAWELRQLLDRLRGRRWYVQVIAKNFETLEPGATWRVLRQAMMAELGSKLTARRTILTGTRGSRLEQIAQEMGARFLPFPQRIGGRYSAFSPVGLLPIAAAGLDHGRYIAGFEKAMAQARRGEGFALTYAAWRNACYDSGYHTEMLCAFEPRLERFARWWRQLFGESEGKQGKGLFPSYAMYSEDLHSIGQFVQDGSRSLIETVLRVEDAGADVPVPPDPEAGDGFDYLDGKGFAQINRAAEEATLAAHREVLPLYQISVPRLDEEAFGWLFGQFMVACAVSASKLGVHPFDQDGVEAYKRRMFRALGRDR